jgi:hypothetical protein
MANSFFFTFGIVHPMLEQVLGLAESDRIAYSFVFVANKSEY